MVQRLGRHGHHRMTGSHRKDGLMDRDKLIRNITMALMDAELLNQADFPDALELTSKCQEVIKHQTEDLIIIQGEVIE